MEKTETIRHTIDEPLITKSALDTRSYRGLQLNNGLKILLVSDPETDKSSAAMDVHIGHLMDPWTIPGLAHFCEHMLFLGTEKYPVENEYKKFLSEHAGGANASTSREHTNFYFDVSPDSLAGALDRFSHFFWCPLFTPSATGREVNAVDNENKRNLQMDSRRVSQLDKSLCRPDHDFAKFGTGNKRTLEEIPSSQGVNVREELLKFHSQYYSSNIMGLCVLGRESLDELQRLVVPLVEKIVNKNIGIPQWDDCPYSEHELQCTVQIVPVKDLRNLTITWPIQDISQLYKANPGKYLGHLIGHEGQGSLLSELKARGWANTLSSGKQEGAKGFAFFSVKVDLTEAGQENTDEITTCIYQYINMLKKQGPQEWIYNECKDLAALSFNFKDKESPRDYTRSLAGRLQKYPMEDVLSVYSLFDDFQPDLINSILKKIVPSNMWIKIVSKKFEGQTDKTEKWYGTHYSVKKFTQAQLEKWSSCGLHENLYLPARNDFIPTNFEIVPREKSMSFPQVIKHSDLCRLWYKQDDKFLKPKACVNLSFMSPLAYIDPLHTNLNALFTRLFDDALTEYSYMAEIAGLRYSLDDYKYGLILCLRGYNDKLPILLTKIMEKMATFAVDSKRLDIFKEKRSRSLKNFQAEQPSQHADFYINMLTTEVLWTKDELLQALDDVTVDNIQTYIKNLLSKVHIEGLIYGNVTKQQALGMARLVEHILCEKCGTKPLPSSQQRRLREFQLPNDSYFIFLESNKIHLSSGTKVYYQCGQEDTENKMLLELFCQIIREPCFTTLRTQEQLGYIVSSGIHRSKGVQGLQIKVQSMRPPLYVEKRIEAFLHHMDEKLTSMLQVEFEKHVKSLCTKRLEKPKRLMEQNSKYWAEITQGFYNFGRDDIETAHLKTITKEDLHRFYKEKLAIGAPERHKLSVHVVSAAPQSGSDSGASSSDSDYNDQQCLLPTPELPEPTEVTDVMEFKRNLGLYPLPKPFIDISRVSI